MKEDALARAMGLQRAGNVAQAEAIYRDFLSIEPNDADALYLLGSLANQTGRGELAVELIQKSIALNRGNAEAYIAMARALGQVNRFEEAVAACREAIRINPDRGEAMNIAGGTLRRLGRLDEAKAYFRQAIGVRPNIGRFHGRLANVLKETGQLDEAAAEFREAIRLAPGNADAHSDLILLMQYDPKSDAGAIYRELRCWNDRHAQPLAQFARPHDNDRDPERRLRIGYVSGDFRDHVVGQNLLPLMRNHDHGQVEVFCYSNLNRDDAITPRFKECADQWRDVWRSVDGQLVDQIRQDRIDILVDLSVHTGRNRLKAFAHKPASVQATFAGYPGSTGMDAMDYRLTDPHLDPPGSSDEFYSETSLRLPSSFWCYDPLFSDVGVNPLPAQGRGFVTFGCLCNFCKVNPAVVGLWMEILKRVDRSRLMILCPEGSHREGIMKAFANGGIAGDRIELVAPRGRQDYVRVYHEIDLGLDTLPYNGHTTSLDSYWMGVPVVTLVGATVVGRAGVSQLTNLGLTELIAQTPQGYIEIAAQLAGDLPRLAELRRTLRDRMRASPLMDAIGFARGIEAAYRKMWKTWCATGGDRP